MSFNVLRFSRSQYLRDTTSASVPSDAYWSYVIALVRTNPDYTGTSSYSARRNLSYPSMGDSDSPTAATLNGAGAYLYYVFPNSPYKTTYPTTDGIYSFSMDTYQLNSSINQYAKSSSSTTGYPAAPGSNLEQTYNYISASYNQIYMDSALDIGVAINGGFTLECWVYVPTTGISTLSGFLLGAQHSVFLFVNSDRTVTAQYSPFYNVTNEFSPGGSGKGGSYPDSYSTVARSVNLWNYTSSATLTAGSWNHVAVTCSYTPQMGTNTGSTNLFINGTRVGQQLNPTVSTGFTGVRTPQSSSSTLKNVVIIGSKLETTGIRFIAGNCLSIDSFTRPTSKVSSNVIGWNGSSSTFTHTACFVTHFTTNGKQLPLIDYSPYRHYVTSNTTSYPVQQTSNLPSVTNPTTNLQSMYFNGVSSPNIALIQNPQQQLVNTTNSVLGFLNNQSFTVNFFFYRTVNSNDYIFDTGVVQLYVTGTQLCLRLGTSTLYIALASGSANTGTWYYVQLSRTNNGGTSKTFKLTAIDQYGTVYSGTDYTSSTRGGEYGWTATSPQLFIGSDYLNTSSAILSGYIVDYRVSGGIVRPTPTNFPNFHPTVAPGSV
jgi:hypothetical protein